MVSGLQAHPPATVLVAATMMERGVDALAQNVAEHASFWYTVMLVVVVRLTYQSTVPGVVMWMRPEPVPTAAAVSRFIVALAPLPDQIVHPAVPRGSKPGFVAASGLVPIAPICPAGPRASWSQPLS